MKFNYQARTYKGDMQSGVVEASSREAALSLLQSYGLFITALRAEKSDSEFQNKFNFFQRISRRDIVVFSRQLAILFKSNVAVVESLQTIANQTKKESFKEKIMQVAEKVEGGTPLSQSFALFPEVFSNFYISVVKSGESSGKLSDVLGYLADHIENEYNFYSKIITAMVYPVFVVVVFIAIMILMSIFVIPQLVEVLLEADQELPFFTQVVIAVSQFLRTKWWILVLGIVGVIIFVLEFKKTPEGKTFIDKLILNLPWFGDFAKKIYLTRMAENLSTLISAGFPIIQALETTGEIVGNDVYRKIINETVEDVKKGEPISSSFGRYPDLFHPLFVQMIIVGEKTGQIDLTLLNIVNYYKAEIERGLDSFIKLLEPIMIATLGLFVGIFMASILLPLYTISFV